MIDVKEINSRADIKRFIQFPIDMYRDVEQYIPPLFGDEVDDFLKDKNPAFEYCEAKCFLAYRDGEIVGRIGAIFSKKANQKWGYRRMRFTQVDFIDDFEVSSALFAAVEGYAREMGCVELHGPLGFCDLDREGMLVEGFGERGLFYTYYNHPYYVEHMERLGFVKDADWLEYKIEVPDSLDKIDRIAQLVLRRYDLHVPKIRNRLGFFKYKDAIFELLNDAYAKLYGVVPLTDAQIKKYTAKFLPLLDPRFTCFVLNEQEELVAFGITAPSFAQALKRSGGRFLPLGVFRILRAMRHNDALDMFLIAVRPDMQGDGINAVLMSHIYKSAKRMGMNVAETGPMLEANDRVRNQWRLLNPVQHKRRRCFIKRVE